MKTSFSPQTTRHALRDSLLCVWVLAASLPMPVLGQAAYATPYTFSTIAGRAGTSGSVDGTNGTARFRAPYGLALDSAGSLYVTDLNSTIRKVTPVGTNWVVTTLAGRPGVSGFADGTNSAATFDYPWMLAVDGAGNIYVPEVLGCTIRKMTPVGTNWVVTTLAGRPGVSGPADGTNSAARFYNPASVAVDTNGSVYVADLGNSTIRKVTPVGTNWVVTTLAGRPVVSGFADGTNNAARFNGPAGVAVDTNGSVYVADSGNNTIRKVTPVGTNWVVTTVAGKAGVGGFADGMNSAARFNSPSSVALDSAGNLYVADESNNCIRKLTPVGTNWMVTTLAGSQIAGSADGTGSAVRFNFSASIFPAGGAVGVTGAGDVAVDSLGNLYVPDWGNYTIRKGYPALVITSSVQSLGFNGGQFGFTVTGSSGQSVVIESSTDLMNWLPLWTNTLSFPAALTFRDSQSSVGSNRFYRAHAP